MIKIPFLCALAFLAACETTDGLTTPAVVDQDTAALDQVTAPASPFQPAPTSVRSALAQAGLLASAYQFEALRIPAGTWDGYVQGNHGNFLQCLVAWGPTEARLGISTAAYDNLFLQFRAQEWPVSELIDRADLIVVVDDAFEESFPLDGNGRLLWVNLGANQAFLQSLVDGGQLSLRVDQHIMVYSLADADIAIQSLYECLDEHNAETGAGKLSVHGLALTQDGRRNLTETTVRALLENGFGDVQLRTKTETVEIHGKRILFSGTAWGGQAQLFAGAYGLQGESKLALSEIVNDAARLCREEVQARLIRMDEPTGFGQFGRSSVLCAGESGEFVLESFAFFDGSQIIVIHAIVDDVNERGRIDESFENLMIRMTAAS